MLQTLLVMHHKYLYIPQPGKGKAYIYLQVEMAATELVETRSGEQEEPWDRLTGTAKWWHVRLVLGLVQLTKWSAKNNGVI